MDATITAARRTTLLGGVRVARDALLIVAAFLAPLVEGGFQLALLLALAAGVVQALLARRVAPPASRGRGPADWPPLLRVFVGALCAWVIVGVLTALLRGHLPRTSALSYVLMSFGVVVGVQLGDADPRRLRRLAWALAVGAALAALLGVSQVLWGSFPGESLLTAGRSWMGQLYVPGTRDRAATGMLLNRLKMSEMWLLCIASGVAACAGASSRRMRLVSGVAVAAGLVMLALTFSKAAMGAATAGVAAVGAMSQWSWLRRMLLPALLATVVAGFVAAAVVGLTREPQLPVPRSSAAIRPWLWSVGMSVAAEHPVLGSGLGTYRVVSPGHMPSRNQSHMHGAHNQHVTVLAEAGLFGIVAWLALLWAVGLSLHRAWACAPPTAGARAVRAWATALVVMLAPMSLVHDVLFHPGTALVFWLACGAALSLGWPGLVLRRVDGR